jgi:hypothetical protein
MKQYKTLLIGIVLAVLPFNSASAIIGFGIQGGNSVFSVGARSLENTDALATIDTGPFENSNNLGIYLYLDIIPFVDLEVDASIFGQEYDFTFSNRVVSNYGPYQAYWGGTSIYFTARRKIVGFDLPILGGAQLFAGGGYNTHSFTPLANFSLIETLMGGSLNADPDFSEKELINFFKDNKIDKTGFHIQGGLKFQLVMLDAFLFYRQTIGEFEDVLDAKTYGSMNLRLGLGF